MSLCVHALYVAGIVTPLRSVTGILRGFGADQAAHQQPGPRADPGALMPAERCARGSPDDRASQRAHHTAMIRGFTGCHAVYAVQCILPACIIVPMKLLKTFPCTWQRRHAGPARYGGTGIQQQ